MWTSPATWRSRSRWNSFVYSNLPIGQNFLVAAYAHSEGEIAPSPSVPIKDFELTVDGYAGAYARSSDMWGESGKIDVLWSRICMKGEATNIGNDSDTFGMAWQYRWGD